MGIRSRAWVQSSEDALNEEITGSQLRVVPNHVELHSRVRNASHPEVTTNNNSLEIVGDRRLSRRREQGEAGCSAAAEMVGQKNGSDFCSAFELRNSPSYFAAYLRRRGSKELVGVYCKEKVCVARACMGASQITADNDITTQA